MSKKEVQAQLEAEADVVRKVARAIAVANRHPDPDGHAEMAAKAHQGEDPHAEPEAPTDAENPTPEAGEVV